MPGIDKSLTFHPLNIAVLTISDTRSLESDASGALLAESLKTAGHHLADRQIVRDDIPAIRHRIGLWAEDAGVDVILTTGGTGFMERDLTPEAVRPLLDKEMDGFAILFHLASRQTVGISTLQSRALAGQIGTTFLFCLPGSPGACRDGWDAILALELDSRHRPCSLAGVIPRLMHLCA